MKMTAKATLTASLTALLAASGITAGADAAYLLVYDDTTGSLTIDTQGGPLHSYILRVDPSAPVAGFDGFFEENHTQVPNNPTAVFFTSENNELSDLKTAFVNNAFVGWDASDFPTSLGNVLPTGLTQGDLETIFTLTQYSATLGSHTPGSPAPPLPSFTIVAVPEPSALALIALGGLMLTRRRR